jgi:hypothetical protein
VLEAQPEQCCTAHDSTLAAAYVLADGFHCCQLCGVNRAIVAEVKAQPAQSKTHSQQAQHAHRLRNKEL